MYKIKVLNWLSLVTSLIKFLLVMPLASVLLLSSKLKSRLRNPFRFS